ncbi:HEAT repeat domain-containing protein [Maioricimonas rarisocia]|nr:HEAT repeat domain-containing protein [Maioricimonas rarisocia]
MIAFCAPDSDSRADEPQPVGQRTYGGHTVDEWRARIKSFNLDDPGIASQVPGLIELTRDTELPWFTRRQAALTLGRIGEPAAQAVPVMESFLHPEGEPEPLQTRLWAMKSLALFGPVAADAAGSIASILQDETAPLTLRLSAVEALGRIGTAAREPLPGLIATLRGQHGTGLADDEQAELQIAAADILMLLRSEASPAVPALIRAAQHDSPRMRRIAATTLGTIGPRADAAIPVLGELILFDEAEDVRDAAAIALAGLGDPAIPALLTLIEDQDVDVRWRAADALGRLPSGPPAVEEALEKAIAEDEPVVRITALESLWSLTRDAAQVAPIALRYLADEDRQIRIRAYRLLQSLGRRVSVVREQLEALVDHPDPVVSHSADLLLEQLNGSTGTP